MKTAQKFAVLAIVAITLSGTSLFADNRHRQITAGWHNPSSQRETLSVEGRITDIDRDRNGFVIRLDRGRQLLFVPVQTRVENVSSGRRIQRTRVRDLERGDVIRAVGIAGRGGMLHVEAIRILRAEDDRYDRNDVVLSGTVERIDRRASQVWIMEARSRRMIAIDVRDVRQEHGRYDIGDLRYGDRITVRGDWRRNGSFEAERIEIDRGAWRR